jgi:excisionase family DNA binding protein
MTKRRDQGANHPTGNAVGENSLTRLVRLIARQEALRVFSGALETPTADAEPARLSNLSMPSENRPEAVASGADPSPEPGEQFLSVAEVALRLDVSEKTVRRRIASGDLLAHRIGKPIRVNERVLTAYLTRTPHRTR